VLDVGTGCGAVALALAQERPDLRVSASDVDCRALGLARENARALGLDVALLHADLLATVPDAFDAVLTNLPYVSESDRGRLAPEISDHEPPQALFAGPDGLSAIRALIAQAGARRRLGMLALEVGAEHAYAVARMMTDAGFGRVRSLRDLSGIERVVVAEGRAR
jgi:release factor glutamine methyltransferase